jgi:hypothetical protein
MDHDLEIIALSAETLAIQTLLAHVLERIAKVDPQLDSAVRSGFDDAANDAENMAIKFGKAANAGHTVKALAIIEALRTATFGNTKKPRAGV